MTAFRLLLALVPSLWAAAVDSSSAQTQPIRTVQAVELFGQVGRLAVGSDEGNVGSGISYSGTVTVPVWRQLALDMDVTATEVVGHSGAPFTYTTRRILLIPSLLYRFGREEIYGFVGGGVGAEVERSVYRQVMEPGELRTQIGWQEVSPGVFELHQSKNNMIASFKGGVAAFPRRWLGLRGDVFMAGWHLGARIGLGYRF